MMPIATNRKAIHPACEWNPLTATSGDTCAPRLTSAAMRAELSSQIALIPIGNRAKAFGNNSERRKTQRNSPRNTVTSPIPS